MTLNPVEYELEQAEACRRDERTAKQDRFRAFVNPNAVPPRVRTQGDWKIATFSDGTWLVWNVHDPVSMSSPFKTLTEVEEFLDAHERYAEARAA